ncbi:hypothetical protein BaRGS_00004111, partial [Batillaria attramentaria]
HPHDLFVVADDDGLPRNRLGQVESPAQHVQLMTSANMAADENDDCRLQGR